MAEKAIIPFGDPILRKVSPPVTDFGSALVALLDDLWDTLYAAPGRAGLAACQVGVLQRVIVIDCGEGPIELINPEITSAVGEQTGPEGCLSFPGFTGDVKRAMHVRVKNHDRNGETTWLEAQGYLAVCIQHEVDHLDGVLYIDRMSGGTLKNDQSGLEIELSEALRISRPGSAAQS
jgi:peptide deformylase